MSTSDYLRTIGAIIQTNRQERGLTQAELATALSTSQSAINRIEKGGQNISLDMISRISECDIISLNKTGKTSFSRSWWQRTPR